MFVPLPALRFHVQSCVARDAFQHSQVFFCFGKFVRRRRSKPMEPNRPHGCFSQEIPSDEARVKTQLQQLRAIAEVRLRSGTVPDWSWPQHVRLIEVVDAMLHDISVAEAQPARRYAGSALRLVAVNPAEPEARRKTGPRH